MKRTQRSCSVAANDSIRKLLLKENADDDDTENLTQTQEKKRPAAPSSKDTAGTADTSKSKRKRERKPTNVDEDWHDDSESESESESDSETEENSADKSSNIDNHQLVVQPMQGESLESVIARRAAISKKSASTATATTSTNNSTASATATSASARASGSVSTTTTTTPPPSVIHSILLAEAEKFKALMAKEVREMIYKAGFKEQPIERDTDKQPPPPPPTMTKQNTSFRYETRQVKFRMNDARKELRWFEFDELCEEFRNWPLKADFLRTNPDYNGFDQRAAYKRGKELFDDRLRLKASNFVEKNRDENPEPKLYSIHIDDAFTALMQNNIGETIQTLYVRMKARFHDWNVNPMHEQNLQNAVRANGNQMNVTFANFKKDPKMDATEIEQRTKCAEGCVFSFYRQNMQADHLFNGYKTSEDTSNESLDRYVSNKCDQFFIGYFLVGQIHHGGEWYDIHKKVYRPKSNQQRMTTDELLDESDDDEPAPEKQETRLVPDETLVGDIQRLMSENMTKMKSAVFAQIRQQSIAVAAASPSLQTSTTASAKNTSRRKRKTSKPEQFEYTKHQVEFPNGGNADDTRARFYRFDEMNEMFRGIKINAKCIRESLDFKDMNLKQLFERGQYYFDHYIPFAPSNGNDTKDMPKLYSIRINETLQYGHRLQIGQTLLKIHTRTLHRLSDWRTGNDTDGDLLDDVRANQNSFHMNYMRFVHDVNRAKNKFSIENLNECAEACLIQFLKQNGGLSNDDSDNNDDEPTSFTTYNPQSAGASSVKDKSKIEDIVNDSRHRFLIGLFLFGQLYGASEYTSTEVKNASKYPDWSYFRCKHCDFTTSTTKRLETHLAKDHDKLPYEKVSNLDCPAKGDGCPESYTAQHVLIKHVKINHSETISLVPSND